MSGHKGYGLGLWVDVMCGVLSGAAYADLSIPRRRMASRCRRISGTFSALGGSTRSARADEFKAAMDDLQGRLKEAPKAEGQSRIYVHGEKEFEAADRRAQEGIPLNPKVAQDLEAIARELDVAYVLAS